MRCGGEWWAENLFSSLCSLAGAAAASCMAPRLLEATETLQLEVWGRLRRLHCQSGDGEV